MANRFALPDDPDARRLAVAVESGVFESLRRAQDQPEREDYWRAHADKLEQKFTTDYGRHYSHFLRRNHAHD